MIDILLSASVPLPERDQKFFDTADVLAIREAIKALVEVVLPKGRITCGGHPAITPLLSLFVREAGLNQNSLTIYQSDYFRDVLPEENNDFADVRFTPLSPDRQRDPSLTIMREAMIRSRSFRAAVFIGGMEGILEEARIFAELHRDAAFLPIASTGAAASIIFSGGSYDSELMTDLTYPTLFRHKLQISD